MNNYSGNEPINVGTGEDISIRELAKLVREVVGYTGEIAYNTTKPDSAPRKLLKISRLNGLGWRAITPLKDHRLRQTTCRSGNRHYGLRR